ncbi:protease inhibitor I42 family protein [Streptomyces sp. NPDC059680]|uniref:protease inhibitor I42 family protein n=1 Tax=Streptomyces TaxID=1883 RepID=UPI001E62AE50|nr:protease inhibitor I42 family protein [Streptomyces barringtoniae]MCC5478709.1 protease inhibitor I42 family protein [Streptomyces barringtoniae]
MTSRTPFLGAAALACLLALTACGGRTGGSGHTGTPSASATPGATVTPHKTVGDEYGIEHRTITAEPGEKFSLSVPAAATLGQHWYLAAPKPDAAVLRYRGERETGDGSGLVGGTGGTQSFGFTALAKGRATVRLLYCPLNTCTGPGPHDRSTLTPSPTGTPAASPASPSPYPTLSAAPRARAGFYVFTITVR